MHNAGKITAPVNTDDVSLVLGLASHDVATLCSSKKINPASRCKPIRFDTPESLTDQQRIQHAGEGVYCGVRLSSASLIGSFWDLDDGSMFEYLRVRPGIDWSRLDDFVGYDHRAMFNPHGLVDSIFLLDSTMGCHVTISYVEFSDYDQTTGIDISSIMKMDNNNNAYDLGVYYPCAMLRLPDGKKFIRALWNNHYTRTSNTQTDGFTTIRTGTGTNAAIWNDWQVVDDNNSLGLSAGDEVYISIFFLRTIVDTGWDIMTEWKEVSAFMVSPYKLYGCPNAIDIKAICQNLISKGLSVISVTYNALLQKFSATWEWADDVKVGDSYTLQVQVYASSLWSVGSASGTYTAKNTPVMLQITPNSVGGISAGKYSYHYDVSKGGSIVNSGSGTFTVS